MGSKNFIDTSDLSYMGTLGLTVKAEFENPQGVSSVEYFTNMRDYLDFRDKVESAGCYLKDFKWLGYVIRKCYKTGNAYILVKGGDVLGTVDSISLDETYSTYRAAKGVATRYYKQDVDDKGSHVSDYTVLPVVNGRIFK